VNKTKKNLKKIKMKIWFWRKKNNLKHYSNKIRKSRKPKKGNWGKNMLRD
jgi:hypothetical protein